MSADFSIDDTIMLASACATWGASERERACGEALGIVLKRATDLERERNELVALLEDSERENRRLNSESFDSGRVRPTSEVRPGLLDALGDAIDRAKRRAAGVEDPS